MRKFGLTIAGLIFGSCLAQAGEKGMMHCFAFTPIKTASPSDWDAFYKATDLMPKRMKFIKRVWVGKLRAPINQYGIRDTAARDKALAGQTGLTSEFTGTRREYGACFWFSGGPEQLKTYTDHPYHKVWTAAYEKVRVAGTTTYDIIGQ